MHPFLYTLVFLSLTSCSLVGVNVEEPKYQVLSKTEDIEIRQYDPMIIAQVQSSGERSEAANSGFRILADFIFGHNQKATASKEVKAQKSHEEIPMTAPVMQQESEEIPMTAPVMQQKQDQAWVIHFVMPQHYTLDTLPKPNDQRVKIIPKPTQKYIVIRFSGFSSLGNLAEHEAKLRNHILKEKIQIKSKPIYAFYNPPWTLPFLRRNEIMFKL